MNSARIFKEVRTLAPVWFLVALAGTLPRLPFAGPIAGLLESVSIIVFFPGISLLATLPLAYEFQYRTFPLLLSQPISHRRIWTEKTLIAAALVLTAGLVYFWGWYELVMTDAETMITAILWVAVTAGAGVFCAVAARSIVGAFTLNTAQCVLIFLALFMLSLSGRLESLSGYSIARVGVPLAVIGGIFAYSVFMLWLGRMALLGFQDKGAGESDIVAGRPRLQPFLLTGLLRSKPNRPWTNLLVKEIRLLWPAWIFVSCGFLVSIALRLYQGPGRLLSQEAEAVAVTAVGVCAGVVVFLSGTLSMGEERALGTYAWQMTMPVRGRTQWIVKIGTGLVTAAAGVVPFFILGSSLTRVQFNVDVAGVLWQVVLTVFVGFWCASAVKGTMRALLWICPVIAAVFAAGALGSAGSRLVGAGWLMGSTATLVSYIPEEFRPRPIGASILVPVLLIVAIHGYRLFRVEVPEDHRLLLRSLPVLMIATFLWVFVL